MLFVKRLISTLLLAAMLVSVAACGGAPADTDSSSGDTTPSADVTTDEYDARRAIDDGLPKKDYGGYTFTIWSLSPDNYYQEEETGDIVDDAIFARQLAVGERFNVEFRVNDKPADYSTVHTMVQESVLAQDNAFDIAMPHQIGGGPTLILQGLVMDWNDVPYINLDQPWWNQRINETIEIMDHQFYIAGQISLPSPFCMYYNKQYVEDYPEIEDMYTLVNEGRWTIDKLLEYTKLVSKDLNGDSEWKPEDDQFGLTMNYDNTTLNFMYASNHMSVLVNEDGEPEPNIVNDKMLNLLEKMNKLVWEDNRTIFCTYENQFTLGQSAFKDGRAFIFCGEVAWAAQMRDFEIDFGVLPYPKYEEEQEGYYTHVDAWNGMLCLPVGAPDVERTGIITEAFAAETYKEVMPIYYDKALGTKYMRDEESIGMLDIVYNGIVYDFGYIFDNWNGCTWMLPRLVQQDSNDITSYWAGNESAVLDNYKKLYEAVQDYDD